MKKVKTILFLLIIFTTILFPANISAKNQSNSEVANIGNKELLFIGDSRFVGMADIIHKLSISATMEIDLDIDNEHYICKSGTHLREYKDTILCKLKQYEDRKDSVIIVYELGVNSITFVDEDIEFLKELENNGWNVYYCDILPIVDDVIIHNSTSPLREYHVKNANNLIYNSGLKVIYFHDECNFSFINNTIDGLHYDAQTYRKWYIDILDTIGDVEAENNNQKLWQKLNNGFVIYKKALF